MGLVFALALVCLWTKREALAAILILPITVNIVAFHLFLDGGLLTPGAVMADALLALNVYFLWQQRAEYRTLLAHPWPGMMRTVFGDHKRFEEMYFELYKGYYFTGDGARRDEDGYYWITGRVDDVINVSGHRMGTAEVESALVSHAKVAEAAVVGFPHEIKGQGIYAYVTLIRGAEYTDALKKELVAHVRNEIGPIAAPDVLHWAPALPKTRSGKIMRRILRKIAEQDLGAIGDTSTLADPSVVEDLIQRDPRKK
jgi:acetyl-CoA synthetase